VETVSSRQNPLVRRFRELAGRRGAGEGALLDGAHLVEEAAAAGVRIEAAAFASRLLRPPGDAAALALARRLEASGTRVVQAADAVLDAMSPVRTPSGIVAIAAPRRAALDAVFAGPRPLAILLVDVQDPGNVGAIVRTAEAAGASGVAACGATADPFGWKALRGAMGSTFRLPVAARQEIGAAVAAARARGLRVLAAGPRGGRPLAAVDLTPPSAVVLGGEGAGLDAAVAAVADEILTIPMRGPVESLNVSAAAAIILYEARRQRSAVRS
jgi:TrmH family RNA methyltransferase